jgi:hypothetical protein
MNIYSIILKMLIIAGLPIANVFADSAEDSKESSVETFHNGIMMHVRFMKSYPTNRKVYINYSILNKSEFILKMIHANGIHDVDLELTGPNGKRITAYHDMEGANIFRGQFKRLYVETIQQGQEDIGDPVELSLFYPLELAGEYRCIMKKRIYKEDLTVTENISALRPGFPVDIASPEFHFRIESIDASYISPAALAVPSLNKPDKRKESCSTSTNDESVNPRHNLDPVKQRDMEKTDDYDQRKIYIYISIAAFVLLGCFVMIALLKRHQSTT